MRAFAHLGGERVGEVVDEVVCRLDADGEPDQVAGCGERGVGGGRVRHPVGMLDQALDTAE